MKNIETIIRNALAPTMSGEAEFKSLWRQSQGSLSKAREIVKALVPHYGATPEMIADEMEFNMGFDNVCAELYGDGCEIEWTTE